MGGRSGGWCELNGHARASLLGARWSDDGCDLRCALWLAEYLAAVCPMGVPKRSGPCAEGCVDQIFAVLVVAVCEWRRLIR